MENNKSSKVRQFFIVPIRIGDVVKMICGSRGLKAILVYFLAYLVVMVFIFPFIIRLIPIGFIHSLGTLFQLYMFVGMVYTILIEWRDKGIENDGALGKALFSSLADLQNAGLQGNGVVLGKMQNELIEKPPEKAGHTVVIGGSGTGKTANNAIPSLLRWKGTGLAIDIKGELSETTAHTRHAVRFSTEEKLARYNPLDFVNEIEDVQEIGRTMFPKPEKGEPFWSQCAQSIFASACWEYKHEKTFAEVAQFLCENPDQEIIETLLDSDQMETRILANTVTNLKPETLGTVFAELRGKLTTIAVDKHIQYATSGSDFSPSEIEESMIYLQVSEHRLKQYGEIFAIIVGQFIRYLTKREEGKNPPVLLLLDEFPRLGKMSDIVSGLATLRSRNVHLFLAIQSLSQLDTIYGKDERKVIIDNCAYKLVLHASDTDTQRYFSDMAGQKTAVIKSFTQGEGVRKEQNFTTQEQSVPLIRPEEFGQLEKPILFAFRLSPAELEQAYWKHDPDMLRMVEQKERIS